jgi:hypothetical protein
VFFEIQVRADKAVYDLPPLESEPQVPPVPSTIQTLLIDQNLWISRGIVPDDMWTFARAATQYLLTRQQLGSSA